MSALVSQQLISRVIAVYGLFMTLLGWGWALFVWGYALVWFLVNDRVKLLAYRVIDPKKALSPGTEPLDLAARTATRAYELYERRGGQDGRAIQDWEQAEREIREDEAAE